MALESVLEHLIAAINANTAAILQTKNLSTASIGPAQVAEKKPEAKPAATKPAATTKPPAPAAQAASAQANSSASAPVTYAALKQAFLTLVEKIGRDPALAVIAPLTGLKQFETAGKSEEMAPILAKLIAAMPSAESLV